MDRNSALMQLYAGDRGRFDRVQSSDEYFDSLEKVTKLDDEIRKTIKDMPKLLDLYQELVDATDLMHCHSTECYYLDGFCFGVLLGIDILSFNNKADR